MDLKATGRKKRKPPSLTLVMGAFGIIAGSLFLLIQLLGPRDPKSSNGAFYVALVFFVLGAASFFGYARQRSMDNAARARADTRIARGFVWVLISVIGVFCVFGVVMGLIHWEPGHGKCEPCQSNADCKKGLNCTSFQVVGTIQERLLCARPETPAGAGCRYEGSFPMAGQ